MVIYSQKRIENPLKGLWWNFFAKIVNSFQPLIFSQRISITDVWQCPKHAYDSYIIRQNLPNWVWLSPGNFLVPFTWRFKLRVHMSTYETIYYMSTYETILHNINNMSTYETIFHNINHMSTYETIFYVINPYVDM